MLDQTISLTVPSTQGVKGKIEQREHRARANEVLGLMARMFGGATATNGVGSCIANDGTLVIEAVIIVESKTDRDTLKKERETFEDKAKFYRSKWGQESVALTVNQSMLFI